MIRILFVMLGVLALIGCSSITEITPKEVDEAEVVRRQLDLAMGYLARGDYLRAKANLSRALLIDPKSALAHTTMGVIFQTEKDMELAEEHYRKAIKYAPALPQSRNTYGAFLFSEKRYEEAIEQLLVATDDRFYQLRPTVFENLGRAYLELSQIENAEQAFTRSIELNPSQPRALLELAELRFEAEAYTEAFALYQRFIRVSEHSARSLWLCIRLSERFSNEDDKASCTLTLKNIFPATEEYRRYKVRYGP